MGTGFFPLDETLGLLPGQHFTPWLVESIVRLGAALPFAQVPPLLAHFTGVTVGVETVRRLTETAGAVQIAREQAALDQLTQTLPDPPPGPAVQLLSLDGAMAPLVGGEWAEVKTLAIGTVVRRPQAVGDPAVTTQALSYCSRLSDATCFGELVTLETHRRGTLAAGTVVAVNDGAVWIQEVIDLQRPDAVRILDLAHAVGSLGQVAQALFGTGTEAASSWVGAQAHALRHGRETEVLATLQTVLGQEDLAAEVREVISQTLHYLDRRREQIRYADFAAAGYPLGSGCVESANKLLVEARLKGAGMHWSRANVNPLLALRCLERNGRWGAEWPGLWKHWRVHARQRTQQRRAQRNAPPPSVSNLLDPVPVPPPTHQPRPKLVVNGKPTRDHPWRRYSPFRAKS